MDAISETGGAGRAADVLVVQATRRGGGERGVAASASPWRDDVRVRPGTLDDLPFIDALQKAHSRELGFLPTAALEGKVRLGEVLIAEVEERGKVGRGKGEREDAGSPLPSFPLSTSPSRPVGYLIAADRYFKRDEVGYVTQINVVKDHRRSLVAATLLQAQFDRSAYGCKLYSCWCAQDLKANEFWEAMGFTPIAFRTGSRKGKVAKGEGERNAASSLSPSPSRLSPRSPRIHIFWQKRVRADDVATPFWYPAQTGGGALREDRLVFPIPPGTHWRDVLPVVLPEQLRVESGELIEKKEEPAPAKVKETRAERLQRVGRERWEASVAAANAPWVPVASPTELQLKLADPDARAEAREAIRERFRKHPPKVHTKPPGVGWLWHVPDYNDYQPNETEIDLEITASLSDERKAAEAKAAKAEARRAAKKAQSTIDPRITAMAREMRDRWLETSASIVALPAKHAIVKRIEATELPKLGRAA